MYVKKKKLETRFKYCIGNDVKKLWNVSIEYNVISCLHDLKSQTIKNIPIIIPIIPIIMATYFICKNI